MSLSRASRQTLDKYNWVLKLERRHLSMRTWFTIMRMYPSQRTWFCTPPDLLVPTDPH